RFLGGFDSGQDSEDQEDLGADQAVDEFLSELTTTDGDSGESESNHESTAPQSPNSSKSRPRNVRIIDAGSRKELDLCVHVPVEDMAKIGEVVELPSGNAAHAEGRTSIWPAIHPLILDLIRQHRSTLIFVNSRRLAER